MWPRKLLIVIYWKKTEPAPPETFEKFSGLGRDSQPFFFFFGGGVTSEGTVPVILNILSILLKMPARGASFLKKSLQSFKTD